MSSDSVHALKHLLCLAVLLLLLGACQVAAPVIPRQLQDNSAALPTAKSLQATIADLANGGGNLGRLAALNRRITATGLAPYLTRQHIDWYSLQKNLIVEIPGRSPNIIYFVAHYDKTDANPLAFVSLMLNGALDTLLSPTFFSDGALDNASGVSVVLELAQNRSRKDNYYTYRFLFAGSEETGLRGSRVHVARLPPEEKAAIAFAVNIDTVGVQGAENCLTLGISDPQLSYQATTSAKKLNYVLHHDPYPLAATSDYLPFQEMGLATDFSYGLQLNFVGGLLPQRSWFSDPGSVPVVNFSSCGIMASSSDFVTNFLLPFGQLHGYRDSTDQVNIDGIYQLYLIISDLLNGIEHDSASKDPLYRTVKSDRISAKKPLVAN